MCLFTVTVGACVLYSTGRYRLESIAKEHLSSVIHFWSLACVDSWIVIRENARLSHSTRNWRVLLPRDRSHWLETSESIRMLFTPDFAVIHGLARRAHFGTFSKGNTGPVARVFSRAAASVALDGNHLTDHSSSGRTNGIPSFPLPPPPPSLSHSCYLASPISVV